MQDLNDLYYFVQVVDHRGFAPASRALEIPKSKLSRRIALLEDRLGARLIQRTSRRFAVTEIGQEYYRRCVAMLVEAEAAQAVIDRVQSEPQGTIHLSCPTGLLNFQFGELIARYMIVYPKVQVRLESTNRSVDVVGEGFDIAIRVRFPPLEETDLVMRRLDESTQTLVASPACVAGGQVRSPPDLAALPSLDFRSAQQDHVWTLRHADLGEARIAHAPRLVTDDMVTLLHAAIAGVGVAQLPTLVVWDDLQAGRLVPLLPAWRPQSGLVHAVFPSRRGLLPSVRALLDFLAAECAAQRRAVNGAVESADASA